MRTIAAKDIIEAVSTLCINAAHNLPEDVLTAIEEAYKKETNSLAKDILQKIITNAQIAKKELYPLCQDTGLAVIFVQIGKDVTIDYQDLESFDEIINEGVRKGFEEGYLRKSVVADPLNLRKNTSTNTPAIIHYEFDNSDRLRISLLLKGGGSENKSRLKIFRPTAPIEEIEEFIVKTVKLAGADACPPFIIGIGIGGDLEKCAIMAKKALLRPIGRHNPDPFYAEFEKTILNKINKIGLGPAGLGGDTTALWVSAETYPTHIASLPVAVNIECHAHRHASIEL